MVAGWHEQTETSDLQNQELAGLQRSFEEARCAYSYQKEMCQAVGIFEEYLENLLGVDRL